MKPALCGKGYGELFVKKIIDYLNENVINLEVRSFNKRAISCYRKCGFVEIDNYYKNTPSGKDLFIKMQYKKHLN